MSRPRKQTVDYFPHYCNHKKTMFILEQKWENNGFAFWFKLLEILGATEGHFYDCNDTNNWEFLVAKTRLTSDICTEILDLLANLGAINQDLWKGKIIWSDNFVEGLREVYSKRQAELPRKPEFPARKLQISGVSGDGNPQRRGEEREVEERKGEEDCKGVKPRRPSPSKMSDEEWLEHIKANPAYKGLDIDAIKAKMEAWCLTKGKQPTRSRLLNWLNREERPFERRDHAGSAGTAKGEIDYSEFRK